MGVPWIPAIAVATLTLRLLAIPAYISMRGFVARSHNSQPEQVGVQAAARKATTQIEKQKRMLEYMTYMRNHNINPLKALLYQLPIGLTFISFFSALRGMTQAKVPSLVEGGVSWFTDLTVSDPYFILPTLSCVSLFLLFRFGGAASEVGPMAEMPYMRKILLYSPFVMLPFLLPQPSVMFIFWITSNIFSFTLLQLFKQPGVERYFGIPEKVRHPQAVMEEMQDMMNPIRMRNKVLREQRAAEDAKIKVKKHLEEMRKFSQDSKKR
uniref:Membrane insertase YidC/Oxa/ALB C-terminal domain-containing protein n=1 Tax=Ciona savignyi TaxID=51511 RepID=H2YKK9_CIOSA